MSPEEECLYRNTFAMMDGSIPSYDSGVMWKNSDIEHLTIGERIDWWKEIIPRNREEYDFISETILTLKHYMAIFE